MSSSQAWQHLQVFSPPLNCVIAAWNYIREKSGVSHNPVVDSNHNALNVSRRGVVWRGGRICNCVNVSPEVTEVARQRPSEVVAEF